MNAFEVVWMAVGSAAVLLGPGWAWSLALFPRRRPLRAARSRARELDVVERTLVALVLSLVLVPLGAILWNGLLRIPLTTPFAILYVVLLTLAGLLVAQRWPGRLGPAEAPPEPDELD